MRLQCEEGRKELNAWPRTQENCELGIHLWRELIVHSGAGALGKEVALGKRERKEGSGPWGIPTWKGRVKEEPRLETEEPQGGRERLAGCWQGPGTK